MSNKLIDFINISKSYGTQTVLDDLNLYIRENEFLTLLGPSGCGKTTTLRILGGFEIPDCGQVIFDGEDITNLPPNKRQLNTVFQKYALFTHMTIAENIAFGLKIKKKSKQYIYDKIKYALKLVNLDGYENRMPDSLSGGQQQRIAIARAIVNEPKVLLLDEPLGALDLKLRQDMQYELIRLKNELGITFIYVTHDQEEALTMSDTIVVMNQGYIQQIGTPERIYNEPENAFVADFIGESNIYTGHMCGIREVDFCGAKFACLDDLPVGAKVDVIVRPEDVIMTAPEDGTITGVVQSVIFKGMHYEIIVESGDNEVVIQSTRSAKEGDTIGMCLEPDGIHVILADTNQNIFEGELTKHYTVEFAGGEYACDVTQLYAGSSINGDGVLVDAEGQEIETAGVKVKVKVPVESIDMSDDTENGDGVCGHIISLIYKGDHYHYVVRTKDDYDFHLHDEYLWNENDYVRLIIPKESIEMSLLEEN